MTITERLAQRMRDCEQAAAGDLARVVELGKLAATRHDGAAKQLRASRAKLEADPGNTDLSQECQQWEHTVAGLAAAHQYAGALQEAHTHKGGQS